MSKPAVAVKKAAEENPGAAFLLTSITVITAVFAALGLTGGVLGRMARNHSQIAGAALILALLAVALGVVAALLAGHKTARWVPIALGLLAFLLAGVAAVYAGVGTWLDETRPQVSAAIERTPRGLLLAINAKMNGLKANRRLRVYVWPVVSERGPALGGSGGAVLDAYSYEVAGLPLHQSINGPNADGDVDYSVKVPLPPQHPPRVVVQAATGDHRPNDCYEKDSRSGCVVLYLGERGRPQLKVSWEATKTGEPLAKLQIAADDIPTGTLFVRALGIPRRAQGRVLLARAHLAPGASGDVNTSLDVIAPASLRALCIVASTLAQATKTCPPKAKQPKTSLEACLRSFRENQQPDNQPVLPDAEQRASCRRGWASLVEQSTGWVRLRTPRRTPA